MTREKVEQAIRELRAVGEKVTVRAVCERTGGSFRELGPLVKLLKDSAEFLEDEEVAALDEASDPLAVPEPTPPPPRGTIRETLAAQADAEAEINRTSRALYACQERLRYLVAHPPQHPTDPDDVSGFILARQAHRDKISAEGETEAELKGLLEAQQATLRALRADVDPTAGAGASAARAGDLPGPGLRARGRAAPAAPPVRVRVPGIPHRAGGGAGAPRCRPTRRRWRSCSGARR